jgi:predicted nucleic acid-binding Zn ribbon protein
MTNLYLYICEHCDHQEEVHLNVFSSIYKTCPKCTHQMIRQNKELMELLNANIFIEA